MVLFAKKLNNSIRSGGVALCSQLKPRLSNFSGKGKRAFFLAGSKLPYLYFWSATVSVFFKKELYQAPALLYVCGLLVNLLESLGALDEALISTPSKEKLLLFSVPVHLRYPSVRGSYML